jgi:hypothetical protein
MKKIINTELTVQNIMNKLTENGLNNAADKNAPYVRTILEEIINDRVLNVLREKQAEIYTILIYRSIGEHGFEHINESDFPELTQINDMIENRIQNIIRVNTPFK